MRATLPKKLWKTIQNCIVNSVKKKNSSVGECTVIIRIKVQMHLCTHCGPMLKMEKLESDQGMVIYAII